MQGRSRRSAGCGGAPLHLRARTPATSPYRPVGVVPVVSDGLRVPAPLVPLVPGRLEVPDVPLLGCDVEFGVLLAPLQLAESIRTELTMTRGMDVVASVALDVPSPDDDRRLRALRREVVEGGGTMRPMTSTCCP